MSTVRQNVSLMVQADGDLETKQLNGRDHLVVPAIILVEGVLHSSNAEHPALALAEEFGIFPEGWDGRPVVYNHPKKNGSPVSANLPDLWDSEVIGQLFSSGMKGKKKLRSYMWLDKEKTPSEVLSTLSDGGTLEVSTGLYALEEDKEGEFEGSPYKSIWRNIVPDHLAVLPKGSIGACSVEDGCGAPRANAAQPNVQGATVTTPAPVQAGGGNASANTAVVASGGTGAGAGSPSGTGAGAAAAAPVVVINAPAAPQTNCGGCGGTAQPAVNVSQLTTLRSSIKKAFGGFLNSLGFTINEISDVDKRAAIDAALAETYGDGYYCYVMALFNKEVVYQCLNMNEGYEWVTYKRDYKVAEGGKVTLGSEIVEVRAETKYVPLEVTVNSQIAPVPAPAAATPAPAAAAVVPAVQPTDNAQGAPMSTTPAGTAGAAAAPVEQTTPAAPAAPIVAAPAPAANAAPTKATTIDALLANASDDVAAQVRALIASNTTRQTALVQALEGKVGLSTDELKALSIASLEKMAAKLNVAPADFSGAAPAPAAATPAANASNFTAAPKVFANAAEAQAAVAARPAGAVA